MIPPLTDFARELQGWRPELQGDPESHHIMHLYHTLIPRFGPGLRMVEVGVAWGRTLLFAAGCCVARGWTDARVYGVDPWLGPGDPAQGYSFMRFHEALGSIAMCGDDAELDLVHLVRGPSPAAAALFPTACLDLVMIDGCHTYTACLADIRAWLPCVREGGVLAGHDFTAEFPGVRRAVRAAFGDAFEQRGSCWAVEMVER